MPAWKTFVLGSAFALLASLVLAAQPADTSIGTWKLNVGKSKSIHRHIIKVMCHRISIGKSESDS